jgi:periplasmic divalent cation tolerance protein
MTDKLLVLSTAGSEAEAQKIAHALVERRLAACVNIVPRIQSVYWWKDKVEEGSEFLLLIKTDKAHAEEARGVIRGLHSYSLPEFITLAIEGGSEEYLHWIEEAIGSNDQ